MNGDTVLNWEEIAQNVGKFVFVYEKYENEEIFTCEKCAMHLDSRKTLELHICKFSTPTVDSSIVAQNNSIVVNSDDIEEEEEETYDCSECPKSFANKPFWQRHMSIVHKIKVGPKMVREKRSRE